MEFYNDHKKLFGAAFALFLALTMVVAVSPALSNQENNAPLPAYVPMSPDAEKGKLVFMAEGCVACHTQQVRNIDMDRSWGGRPSIAADYASNQRTDWLRNTATLMGTERTGPDLTNVGNRQPGKAWHLLHLYQPRAVSGKSIMPAYPWLFEEKDVLAPGETEISVPDQFRKNGKKVVPTTRAMQLVAYLQSLKQVSLPDGTPDPEFLYKRETEKGEAEKTNAPDGRLLYAAHCQSCHQENGEGLKGAFPALKGSAITQGDDLDLYVSIIMKGFDARPEFAVMPPVGSMGNLSPEEVTAIINYERSAWGNKADPVDAAGVKSIMEKINAELP